MEASGGMILTADELDAIGEIMNISMGASATAVSAMLDRQVTITTPRVYQSKFEEVDAKGLEPALVVKIDYVEGLTGNNIIMLRRHDMQLILNLLMGNDITEDDEDFEFDEMSMSAACEVMNQMMGASSTALSEILGMTVNISTPKAHLVDTKDDVTALFDEVKGGDQVVDVSFRMSIAGVMDSDFSCFLPTALTREIINVVSGGMAEPEPAPAPAPQPAAAAPPQPAPQPQQPAHTPPPEPAPQPQAAYTPPPEPAPQPQAAYVPPPEAAPQPQAAYVPPAAPAETAPAQQPAYAPPQAAAPPAYSPPAAQMPAGQPPYYPQVPPEAAPYAPAAAGQPPYPGYPPYPPQGYPYPQYPGYGYPPMGYPPQSQLEGGGTIKTPQISVKKAQFPSFSDASGQIQPMVGANASLLMGVPLEVSIVIGKAKRKIREILEFGPGTVVDLDKQTGAPAEIIVNGQLLAYGDVIVIGDNFGVRITEIVGTKELLDSLDNGG